MALAGGEVGVGGLAGRFGMRARATSASGTLIPEPLRKTSDKNFSTGQLDAMGAILTAGNQYGLEKTALCDAAVAAAKKAAGGIEAHRKQTHTIWAAASTTPRSTRPPMENGLG